MRFTSKEKLSGGDGGGRKGDRLLRSSRPIDHRVRLTRDRGSYMLHANSFLTLYPANMSDGSGFNFDLCKRNAMLSAKGVPPPRAWSTGTTIAGVIFKEPLQQAGACPGSNKVGNEDHH
eukprot:1157489-Pelagomonas_calceolata.AAC.5